MGLIERTKTVIGSKVNKVLEKFEKPTETMDYAYEKQIGMLQDVKRGITELATAKKRLEMQKQKLLKDAIDMDGKAKESLRQGNEEMARLALERKSQIEENVQSLTVQIKKLGADQDKLIQTEKTLEFKLEQFRTQKEVVKAQYGAAEAQVKIGESLSGISKSTSDIGTAMNRAKDKTEAMSARASAIDELTDSGVLTNVGDEGDSIDRELAKINTKGKVDVQLEQLKGNIGKTPSKNGGLDLIGKTGTKRSDNIGRTIPKGDDNLELIGKHR
jgi:phage shock protein A